MENMADWEQKILVNELTQGRELAKQLQIHLNVSSSPHETREMLVQKILTSYDKALSILKWSGSTVGEPSTIGFLVGMSTESPRSLSGSPHSEDSERDFKDQEHKDASRKSKCSQPRWTKQVQVCPGTGVEGPLDDGYNWRKYGQKDILGARFPRGYYRCTHRNVQGCLATKQVQRSDEDPTIFEITYRGRHTCTQASHTVPSPSVNQNQFEQNESKDPQQHLHYIQQQQQQPQQQQQQNQQQSREMLINFRTGLKVMTEDLDTAGEHAFPSFYGFPSTSDIKVETEIFSSPSMLDNNNFMGGFCPSFMSPATSESNYFSVSPHQTNTTFGGNQNLQVSESGLTEIISAAATSSAATSPTLGLNLQPEFDPNFTFDNPGFFS